MLNITAYRFLVLAPSQLPPLQLALKKQAKLHELKGTILLSPEGINLSLAGTENHITQFKVELLNHLPQLADLNYRETYSETQPFQKMLVKIKKQIIPFPDIEVPLKKDTAPYISPEVLRDWFQEKRDIVLLDTRNHYEVAVGSFQNAMQLNLQHFIDFPKAIQALPSALKDKPIVTFCTGGIRCEKAATSLIDAGFKAVYQLQGGILKYFECCGNSYYEGGCFVFDEREVIHAA